MIFVDKQFDKPPIGIEMYRLQLSRLKWTKIGRKIEPTLYPPARYMKNANFTKFEVCFTQLNNDKPWSLYSCCQPSSRVWKIISKNFQNNIERESNPT